MPDTPTTTRPRSRTTYVILRVDSALDGSQTFVSVGDATGANREAAITAYARAAKLESGSEVWLIAVPERMFRPVKVKVEQVQRTTVAVG